MTWSSITGWLRPTVRGSWLVIVVLLTTQVVTAAPREAEPAPDPEFLEFLGSWQTHDGQWVDPLQVEDLPAPDLDPPTQPRSDSGNKKMGRGRDRQAPDQRDGSSPSTPEDEFQSRRPGK